MSNKLDIIGIGYPSLDYILKLNDYPSSGKTTLIVSNDGNTPYYGGCAVNVAYLLNTYGKKSGLTMKVGYNFASSGFESFLSDNDIDLTYVDKDNAVETSYTKLLMQPDGEHITLFYAGPMTKENYTPTNFDGLDARYGLITIGELESNKHFLKTCIDKNISTVFSMKGDYHSLEPDYVKQAIEYSEVIFMNETEYNQLSNYLPMKVIDYIDDNKTLVITLGSEGSLIFNANEDHYIPAYPDTNVVDTAGGGDAYIAGFMNEYLSGNTLLDAGAKGSALASCIIEGVGCLTNIPTEEELDRRIKLIKENLNDEKTNALLRTYRG